MDDALVLKRIEELVEEERELREQAATHDADADAQARLEELEISLDQCWDLLRRRRAIRDAGGDPDQADARPETTVERYLQ